MKNNLLASIFISLVTTLGVMTYAPSVNAQAAPQALACGANSVDFNYDSGVFGDAGSTQLLVQLTVPAELQTKVVAASASVTNNGSIHPGNQIIIASNTTSIVLDDVEATTPLTTTATGSLTLGTTVDVSVKFGNDPARPDDNEVFSGDGELMINVDCTPPAVNGAVSKEEPQVLAMPVVVNAGEGGASHINPTAAIGLVASVGLVGASLRRLYLNRKG